jgi:hypothetical protein
MVIPRHQFKITFGAEGPKHDLKLVPRNHQKGKVSCKVMFKVIFKSLNKIHLNFKISNKPKKEISPF